MVELSALWLPILLSAVIVFFVSSIIHMAPLWHRGDYPKVPHEDELRAALRPLAIPPGDYMVPRSTNAHEMRSPEFLEKVRQGPMLMLTVMPNGPISMARSLVLWFLYAVLVSFFAAYIATRALPTGAEYMRVFQLTSATVFIGYSLGLLQMSIWYRRAWSLTIKAVFDGFLYALLAAGTFAWLWPR